MSKQGMVGISIAALVGALSGAAGGFVSGQAAGSPTAEKKERQGHEPAERESDEEPERAAPTRNAPVRSETQRIAALERRVSLLTAALARGDSTLATPDSEGENEKLDEVDVADPVFEAAVLDIMDREEERRDDERESRREQLVVERGRRVSTQLTESLGLTADQQQRIAQVVTDHFNEFRDLRSDDAPNRPITRRDWQERMEAINETALKNLQGVLTKEQFEKYEKLDPDDQISFGWGRGRGTFEGSVRPSESQTPSSERPSR